jgi:peptidoglycan glycosyltransferase
MSCIFFSLAVYLTYFQIFESEKVVKSPYNRRQSAMEDDIKRGSIFDKNGIVLAQNNNTKDKRERVYPFGALYSHVIGYNSIIYGRALVEDKYNDYLLNVNKLKSVVNLNNSLLKGDKQGNNLYLSIDHNLQKYADRLMGNKKGAVVAMNPKTGAILAMVSKPDFDPNNTVLVRSWKGLADSQDSPFLPRATQGLYAPGSTFKVAIAAAALENGLEDITFDDKGSVIIDGKEFSNSRKKAYGKVNLESALTVSSNVAFSQIGVKLGSKTVKEMAAGIGMEGNIPFDIPVNKSTFPYNNMGKTDLAAVGIGQGKMLVSPLHMAMVASCIANKGVMMKPFMVTKAVSPDGKEIKKWGAEKLYNVMSADTAEKVKQMMIRVVKDGTGKSAAINGITVAGKTGTAENELTGKEKNKEHAWFISFAPAENPQIAVAVIVEYCGSSGGTTSAPIAGKLMESYLTGIKK